MTLNKRLGIAAVSVLPVGDCNGDAIATPRILVLGGIPQRHKCTMRYCCAAPDEERHPAGATCREVEVGYLCPVMVISSDVLSALRQVKYPGFSRDIVSFGIVRDVRSEDGVTTLVLAPPAGDPALIERIRPEIERVVGAVEGIGRLEITTAEAPRTIQEARTPARPAGQAGAAGHADHGHAHGHTHPHGPRGPQRIAGVNRIIAVASGKGGVGKSTCSVNLACALAQLGLEVGLLDCDIYGPSIPLMMGVRQRPFVSEDEKLVPPMNHGVKLMSMGFLLDGDQPVIWRGPMIQKTIQQFITQVEWGRLDILLVDLPPGTGDAQLSLCQTVPLDGGVIVTTPQEASLGVVRKGIAMFQKVNVPILGIVENMSYFTAPDGSRVDIFGHGGGKSESARQGFTFLGEVPIFVEIREGGDSGVPAVVSTPKGPAGQAFHAIAKALQSELE